MPIAQLDSPSSPAFFTTCDSKLKMICRFKVPPFSQTRPPICVPKEEYTGNPQYEGNYSKRLITTSEHFSRIHGVGHLPIHELEQWMPQGKRRKLEHHRGWGAYGPASSSSSTTHNETISNPTQTPGQSTGREPPTATEAMAHEQQHRAQETLTHPREGMLMLMLRARRNELMSVENHIRDLNSLYRRKKALLKELRRKESTANSDSSDFKSLRSTLGNLWDGQFMYMKTRMSKLKAIEGMERKLRMLLNAGQIPELKAKIELLVKGIGAPAVDSEGRLMNPLDALD